VDHERFTPGDRALAKQKLKLDGKQVLCTVARIQRYKGHEVVLRALSRLSPHERAAMAYLVVGTGPHRQELQRLAIQLGVDSIVRWCAFVPEEELSLMYQASDLFVLCTQEAPAQRVVEGFGLVFLEAQACGTPVVGTRTGGIGDAVKDGDGGWLIEQDDSAALSGILRRLVSSPDIFHAEGERARKRVLRECTWERYVGRFSAAVSRAMVKYE
jgi:phosphatidylinositol alpha-1,6-mannosyltransferase